MGQWINDKWKYEKRDIKRAHIDKDGKYHGDGELLKACNAIRWAYGHYRLHNIGKNDAEVDCWLARKALDIPYKEICWENNLERILDWLNGKR